MNLSFKGIFAPLTTPFEGGNISTENFRENILKYNNFDLSGYVILGSTGESIYLTDEESEKLLLTAIETVSSGKKIIVGTARESTKVTLEFTNRMAALGPDAALIRTPSYFKNCLNRAALKNHFLTIADHSKLPIIVYNIPQNTGISIDQQLILKLSKHPNIIGMKDSSGNLSFLGEVITDLDSNFNFLLGAGSILFPGLIYGASGGIITLSNIVPDLCIKLYNLSMKRKLDEARRLQLDLVPLNQVVTKTLGVPAAKYALDLLGYYGGPCRLPLLPLDEKDKNTIEDILNKLNLLRPIK